MISGIPAPTGSLVQRNVFYGTSPTEGAHWQTYDIPANVSMLYIFLWGAGGGGGNSFVGGDDSAGGGGGGGSGGQTRILLPAPLVPSTLYLSIGLGGVAGSGGGATSRISIYPDLTANHCLARAAGGNNGGTATLAAAGGGGIGGAVAEASAANMPLGYMGLVAVVGGVNGTAGARGNGDPVNAAAITSSTTTTNNGGSGGGGHSRSDDVAATGGPRNTIDNALFFPVQPTSLSGDAVGGGSNGFFVNKNLLYTFGGLGGRSAGEAGLTGGPGGAGGYGSGGGGGGSSFTGGVAAPGGRGGDGLAVIYAW